MMGEKFDIEWCNNADVDLMDRLLNWWSNLVTKICILWNWSGHFNLYHGLTNQTIIKRWSLQWFSLIYKCKSNDGVKG